MHSFAFGRSNHATRFIHNIDLRLLDPLIHYYPFYPFTTAAMETPTASEGERYVSDLLGGATDLLSMTSSAESSARSSPATSPFTLRRKIGVSSASSCATTTATTTAIDDGQEEGGGAAAASQALVAIAPVTTTPNVLDPAQMMQIMASNQQAVASSQQMMQHLAQCILRTDEGVVKVRGEVRAMGASVDELRDSIAVMQERIDNKEAEAVIDNTAARFVAWCMKRIGINTFDGVSVFWGHGGSVAIYAKALYELIWAGTQSTSRKMYGVSKFDHIKYALVALGGREAGHDEYDAVYKSSPLSPEPSKSKKRGHCIIMISAAKLRAILGGVQSNMMMCPIDMDAVAKKKPNCCSKGVRQRNGGIVWGEEWSSETMKASGLRELFALSGGDDKHVDWGGVEAKMRMSSSSQLASEKDDDGSSDSSSGSGSDSDDDDDATTATSPRTMRSSADKKRRITRRRRNEIAAKRPCVTNA